MTVSKTGLEAALTSFFDPDKGLPASNGNVEDHQKACAKLWADAMQTYVVDMDPDHAAAAGDASSNLQTALEGVFAAWFALDTYPEAGCADMNAAFTAFAADIFTSAGSTYLGRAWIGLTMPTPPIDFCSIGTADTYADAASNFATLIDNWFTTGTSKTTDDNGMDKLPLTSPWL